VADSKELAIFVENCGVTEAISKKSFHYSRHKGCSQGIGNGFHASKTTHATTADYTLDPLNPECFSALKVSKCITKNEALIGNP
jgi:hypothetical protein